MIDLSWNITIKKEKCPYSFPVMHNCIWHARCDINKLECNRLTCPLKSDKK